MFSYGQFCAVARGLELIGDRWTLLVARELLLGATSFNEVRRGLPKIPTATLSARLRKLEHAGMIERGAGAYALTPAGMSLQPVVASIAQWAMQWDQRDLTDEQLDTEALCWDIQRRINRANLPANTVVIAFEFTDRPVHDRHFWLHVDRLHTDLCRMDTGAPVDLTVRGSARAITAWWLGERTWNDLVRRDDVVLDGPRSLVRAFPTWFDRYLFAAPDAFDRLSARPRRQLGTSAAQLLDEVRAD